MSAYISANVNVKHHSKVVAIFKTEGFKSRNEIPYYPQINLFFFLE